MLRLVLISVTLFVFWLLLSGHYDLWLITSGATASLLIVGFCLFKRITDDEGFPFEKILHGFVYWPWLGLQIVRSALNVSRIILDPKLPISPRMVRVRAKAESAVGLVTYANSITLTPGTISVEVGERARTIWVHAITAENADGFTDDEMNARVARMDGIAPPPPPPAQAEGGAP